MENGATVPSVTMLGLFAKHFGVDVVELFHSDTAGSTEPAKAVSVEDISELAKLLSATERQIMAGVIQLLLSNRGR
ncbi:hypothetical protein GCM10011611_60980 [Aliidongia dinghuensis]|uniref:HTH cro/C1-type domain-containing protein n=1 Tax=Aliidongia dinghuensis TaxID=1867774 RepID=A0A8J2YZM7_9PROT|nr:hypothetical protein GCM10011611_60980 [Aliidongia dinghuensis]